MGEITNRELEQVYGVTSSAEIVTTIWEIFNCSFSRYTALFRNVLGEMKPQDCRLYNALS